MSSATEPRWLDDAEQQAWRAYLSGTARLLARLEADLAAAGLSLAEYEILVRLSEAAHGRLRMAGLADSVEHSRSRLTHTITRLERAGLVRRTSCATDGRGVFAELTEVGLAKLQDAAPVHVEGVRRYLVDVVDRPDLLTVGRAFRAVAEAARPAERSRPPAAERVA